MRVAQYFFVLITLFPICESQQTPVEAMSRELSGNDDKLVGVAYGVYCAYFFGIPFVFCLIMDFLGVFDPLMKSLSDSAYKR